MVPFPGVWLRCSASSRCRHPGPRPLASGCLGLPCQLCMSLSCCSGDFFLASPLEAHLEALSSDEEDGFLFLENSIPSPFLPQHLRPRAPSSLGARRP